MGSLERNRLKLLIHSENDHPEAFSENQDGQKKWLLFPGKQWTKKKIKVLYKIEDNSKDEKPKSSTKPIQQYHECSEDGEGERSVRKSIKTAMVVMQSEREANCAALQATMRVSFIKRKKESEEKRMSWEEMLLEPPQTDYL